MPALFLKMNELFLAGNLPRAQQAQYAVNEIISVMCTCRGNLYAVIKKALALREQIFCGGVWEPLYPLTEDDMPQVRKCADMIDAAIAKFC